MFRDLYSLAPKFDLQNLLANLDVFGVGTIYTKLYRGLVIFGSGLFKITATVCYGQIRLFSILLRTADTWYQKSKFVQICNFFQVISSRCVSKQLNQKIHPSNTSDVLVA